MKMVGVVGIPFNFKIFTRVEPIDPYAHALQFFLLNLKKKYMLSRILNETWRKMFDM